MSLQRKKKPVEFHFVDMNDPERYKKLKVARACDFCRRRKSKCDIGIPGSGTCSNCKKHQMVCIFSPVLNNHHTRGNEYYYSNHHILRPEEISITPQHHQQQQQRQFNLFEQFLSRFPLLQVKDGQVGYEKDLILFSPPITTNTPSPTITTNTPKKEPSLKLEKKLFKLYFNHVHSAFPVLLKESIMNIHNQDRFLLSKSLRYSIMALACHYFPNSNNNSTPSTPASSCSSSSDNNTSSSPMTASNIFYDTAKQSLSLNTPRLDTVQSLLLLFKHNEINCLFKNGIYYLEKAQEMIGQIQSIIPQQQEMINRSRWILFGCISLSNLSDTNYSKLYKNVDLPIELPQPLKEEEESLNAIEQQHVNRFAQIANLSVLYSHTVQSMMTHSTSQLICLKQFKEIRQHWHDSLHPITQSRLVSVSETDEEEIDILILYSAVLYDMLYLLLLSHHNQIENKWDGIETAYRLQRMIHTWVIRPSFTSAVQSRRMSAFALMICLNIQISREDDKIDFDSIQQIQQSMKYIQLDTRIDNELSEVYSMLTTSHSTNCTPNQQQQQPLDYFSIIPQQFMNNNNNVNTPSSIDNPINTPGLWSVTTNGGLTTPLREEMGQINHQVTSEWIIEQQRRQDEQFQLYQLQQTPQQQQQQYQTTLLNTYINNNNNNSINYSSSSNNNTPLATTPSFNNNLQSNEEDYFYFNPGQWSPSIEQLSTSTNYLKLNSNNTPTREVPPPFVLQNVPSTATTTHHST